MQRVDSLMLMVKEKYLSAQCRFLDRAEANGKQEVAVLLKRGIRNDARPSGMELFKKVGLLAKMQSSCAHPL